MNRITLCGSLTDFNYFLIMAIINHFILCNNLTNWILILCLCILAPFKSKFNVFTFLLKNAQEDQYKHYR